MTFIKPSTSQQETFQEVRELFVQRQAEARAAAEAEQARLKDVENEQIAKRYLCQRAAEVAGKVAVHSLFVGNRMGADKEMFSDWATLSEDEDENTALQASMHSFVPDEHHETRHATIDLRLKDRQHEVWSKAETIATFDIERNQTFLHDNDTRQKTEVLPNTPEYTELVELLNKLEVAEYEVTGEPLIGV